MHSVNDVRIVGRLVEDPQFMKTTQGREYVKLRVRTSRFFGTGKGTREISYVHDVMCIQSHSIKALRSYGRKGVYVRVFGELGYAEGKARIQVQEYMGEVALMLDLPAPVNPEPAREQSRDPKATGGLGKVRGTSGAEEVPENINQPERDDYGSDPLGPPDPQDDQIPY